MREKTRFIWFTLGFCLLWAALGFFIFVSYSAYKGVPGVRDLETTQGIVKSLKCEEPFRRRNPWHILYLTLVDDMSNQRELFIRSRLFTCDGINKFRDKILNQRASIKKIDNEMWEILVPPYSIVDFKRQREEETSKKIENIGIFSFALLVSIVGYVLALRGYRKRRSLGAM